MCSFLLCHGHIHPARTKCLLSWAQSAAAILYFSERMAPTTSHLCILLILSCLSHSASARPENQSQAANQASGSGSGCGLLMGHDDYRNVPVAVGCQICWNHPEHLICTASGSWEPNGACPSGRMCKESPSCSVSCVPIPI